MTATVTAGATALSAGTVTFRDTYNGITEVLGTVQVQSSHGVQGNAILLQQLGGLGTHSIVATFNAPKTYKTSSSSPAVGVTLTGSYPTTSSISSSGAPGSYSLTATVLGIGSSIQLPTGNVSFVDTSNSNLLLGVAGLGTTGTPGRQTVVGSNSPINVGKGPQSVAAGDFNGDGFIDLAVLNITDNTISILKGDGTGKFTAFGTPIPTGTTPVAIVAGDFNGDGKLDLAVANSGNQNVDVLLGNADYTFTAQTVQSVSPLTSITAIATGDFNGDGVLDIAVAGSTASNGAVVIMKGDGAGGLSNLTASGLTVGNNPSSITVADFDGDGNLDFAVANNGGKSVSVLLGDGSGTTFSTSTFGLTNGSTPNAILAVDLNRDGHPDLVIAEGNKSRVDIYKGNGDGTFTLQGNSSTGNAPVAIAAGDFNSDGYIDLAVANSTSATASILIGNGTFTFQPQATSNVGAGPSAVAAGDFNGDGVADLAVANFTDNDISILLNQVTDTASALLTGVSIPGSGNHNVDAAYQGDSTPGDTNFNASTSSSISLVASQAGTTALLSANTTTPSYGQQVSLTATLVTTPTAVGSLTPTGTVTFYDFGASIGTATVSGGSATFNTTTLSTGNHSITAKYNGDTNFSASPTTPAFGVIVGKATPVITWANPSSITYGTLLSSTQLNATESVNGSPVAGTFAYNPAAGSLLAIGTTTLNVTFTPTDSTDYTIAPASVSITVNQATPIISWATPAAIAYGTPLSGVQLNATVTSTTLVPLSTYYNVWGIITDGSTVQNGGLDGGGNSYSGNELGTSISWNGVTYPMGPVNAADAVRNITINLPQGQFASLNMLGTMVNNAAGPYNFVVTYTDGSQTTFSQNLSDWVYPQNYAGESNLKCNISRDESGGVQDTHSTCVYGYQFTLNSSKIVQSVTLPNSNNVVMLAMGLTSPPVAGTMVYSPAAGTVPSVGTDTLSVTFTPTNTVDYSSASASVQLVVNPAVAYINWPTPAPINYGTPLSSTQLDASALTATGVVPVPISAYYRTSAFFTDGVSYQVGGFDNNGNSFSANQLGTTIAYNGINFLLGPPSVPDAVTSTTVSLPQGNFTTLSFIGAAANAAQTNQTFTVNYTDGTTTVVQQSLSNWTASSGFTGETIISTTTERDISNGSQVAGSYNLYGYQIALNSAKTVSSITLPNNLNVVILGMALSSSSSATNPIPGTYVYTPASGTILAPGTQTLSVTFTPTDTTHYGTATATVSLVVNKQPLVVTANNETAVYGSANPAYTYTITGFVNGDTQLSATSGAPSLTTTPATPVNAGPYTIVAALGTLTSSKYSFTFVNGTLTITPAAPTITFTVANQTYGAAPFAVSATSNSTGAFTYTVVSGPATISGSTVTLTGAGTVVLQASEAADSNYAAATKNATFTVGRHSDDHLHRSEPDLWRGTLRGARHLELDRGLHLLGGLGPGDHLGLDRHPDRRGHCGAHGV